MENLTPHIVASGNVSQAPEFIGTADDFCLAVEEISDVMRLKLLESMFGNAFGEADFEKIDEVLESPQMQAHLETAVGNGNYPECLSQPGMRAFIFELSAVCIMGGLVDKQYRADRRSVSSLYFERMVEMNNLLAEFAESKLADQVGFGRSHLKRLICVALQLPEDAERVVGLEKGIAVEVGTKKAIDELGEHLGMAAYWSTAKEDMRKIDLVCQQGDKKMYIQVKSSDSVAKVTGSTPAAGYSRPEEYNLHEYRVTDLHPAAAGAIGERFEINARGYLGKISELLEEFSSLN